jgi:hypothetical protein
LSGINLSEILGLDIVRKLFGRNEDSSNRHQDLVQDGAEDGPEMGCHDGDIKPVTRGAAIVINS